MASFKDNFWSGNGFEVVDERMVQGKEITKEVYEFYEERASIEENYVKSLLKLAKSFTVKDELGSLRLVMDQARDAVTAMANAHLSFANKLLNDFVKPLKAFKTEQKKLREKHFETVSAIRKEVHSSTQSTKKAGDKFHLRCRDAEAAKEASAQPNLPPAEQTKAQQKAEKTEKEAQAADKEYRQLVERTQKLQEKMDDFLSVAFEQYALLEDQRITKLGDTIAGAVDVELEMNPGIEQELKKVRTLVEKVDPAADMAAYAKAAGTGTQHMELIQYLPYPGRAGAPVGTSATSAGSNSVTLDPKAELAQVEAKLDKETKSREALSKMMEIQQEPGMGPKMQAELDSVSKSIADLEKRRDELRAQLGLSRKDSAIVAAPPSPSISRRMEMDQEEKKLNKSPSNVAALVTSIPKAAVRVRGAFDYEAQDPVELSFKEGDVILVTEKHDSGWWTGECGGKVGIFPVTYVDPLPEQ